MSQDLTIALQPGQHSEILSQERKKKMYLMPITAMENRNRTRGTVEVEVEETHTVMLNRMAVLRS